MTIKDHMEIVKSKAEKLEDKDSLITKYELILNSVKGVIFQTDAEGLWTYLNRPWEEITGFSIEESLGNPFLDYVYPDDRTLSQQLFTPLIERKKESCRHTIRYLMKDGGFKWIEVLHKSMHSSIISSIQATLFEKSHETQEHAERLVELSKSLGKALSLTDKQMKKLALLSTLHDIGKMSIDDQILSKPGKLTDEEWSEMKQHPEIGYRIAQASPDLRSIADYILSHHERWDGAGYPQGLRGESIPLLSRILLVVDAYDAMTQDKHYRKAMSRKAAITEIMKNAGTQFDFKISKIFVEKVLGEAWG